MVKKAFVDFDKENDIVYFYTGEKVKDSLRFDCFIFDFSQEDKIIGLEIKNASTFFKNLDIPISIISKIKDLRMSSIQQREYILVRVVFLYNKEEKTIPAMVPIPQAIRAR